MRLQLRHGAVGMVALLVTAIICGCAGTPDKHPQAASETRMLSGAELYAINCNRCHPERSAVERNAAEWNTIMIHMRVRANLPAAQARAILGYLQANGGN